MGRRVSSSRMLHPERKAQDPGDKKVLSLSSRKADASREDKRRRSVAEIARREEERKKREEQERSDRLSSIDPRDPEIKRRKGKKEGEGGGRDLAASGWRSAYAC